MNGIDVIKIPVIIELSIGLRIRHCGTDIHNKFSITLNFLINGDIMRHRHGDKELNPLKDNF